MLSLLMLLCLGISVAEGEDTPAVLHDGAVRYYSLIYGSIGVYLRQEANPPVEILLLVSESGKPSSRENEVKPI